MGLFDYFEPNPPLKCPKCFKGEMVEWEGKHSSASLFRWRQGIPYPIAFHVDPEIVPSDFQLSDVRLPQGETIYAYGGVCDSCGFGLPGSFYSMVIDTIDSVWKDFHFEDGHGNLPIMGQRISPSMIQCSQCCDVFCSEDSTYAFCEECNRLVEAQKS